jgi:hypothetical protein
MTAWGGIASIVSRFLDRILFREWVEGILAPYKRETMVRVMYKGSEGLAEGGHRPTGDRPSGPGTRGVSCGNRSLLMNRRWR